MTQPVRSKRIKAIAKKISSACRCAEPLLKILPDVIRIGSLIARLYDHCPWL